MMSEKIRILLIKKNVKIGVLASMLDTSSSNVTNKLKRENFSEKDLHDIAAVLDCKYVSYFELEDGTKI